MTHPMTQADMEELREAALKATPGPWIRSGVRQKLGDEDCIRVGPDGYALAFLPIGQPRDHAAAFCDARFIAMCREAVPALLSTHDAYRARIEELEKDRDALIEAMRPVAFVGRLSVDMADSDSTIMAARHFKRAASVVAEIEERTARKEENADG